MPPDHGWILREKDRSKDKKRLQLTKGIHLVIDQRRFPLRQAIYFDTPDGRMIFAIPRDGKTYVGTTDTVYQGDMEHPRMTSADRQYVIDAINYMFPSVNITVKDIESSWTGLRPLIYEEGKSASEISRKDEVWQSPSGLITIAGGKLTGYRKMAEMVVDLVVDLFKQEHGASFPSSSTKNMPISGGKSEGRTVLRRIAKGRPERDWLSALRWSNRSGWSADTARISTGCIHWLHSMLNKLRHIGCRWMCSRCWSTRLKRKWRSSL